MKTFCEIFALAGCIPVILFNTLGMTNVALTCFLVQVLCFIANLIKLYD